jgi:cysteine sulfinate desulfinase/cysteine desulfurase-like protein
MGFDPERARGLLRVSLGRFNTQKDVDRFLEILPGAVVTLSVSRDAVAELKFPSATLAAGALA